MKTLIKNKFLFSFWIINLFFFLYSFSLSIYDLIKIKNENEWANFIFVVELLRGLLFFLFVFGLINILIFFCNKNNEKIKEPSKGFFYILIFSISIFSLYLICAVPVIAYNISFYLNHFGKLPSTFHLINYFVQFLIFGTFITFLSTLLHKEIQTLKNKPASDTTSSNPPSPN